MTRTIVTPQVKAQILALARDGKTNVEIEKSVNVPGLSAAYIAAVITKERTAGALIPYRSKGWAARAEERNARITSLVVRIDVGSLDYLKRAGERRGIEPAYLAGALIEAIARDKIADAVLDDGVTT